MSKNERSPFSSMPGTSARNIASTMGYFFYERENDVKNLADSREVLTYRQEVGLLQVELRRVQALGPAGQGAA